MCFHRGALIYFVFAITSKRCCINQSINQKVTSYRKQEAQLVLG